MKVLLVDDSPADRIILARHIRNLGHSVVMGHDGREAIDLVTREDPDLVVMDMRMPDMDGLAAAREIRKVEDGWRPIIFLSGQTDTDSVVAGIASGADDYLFKPIDQRILAARMKAFERIARMRAQLILATRDLEAARDEARSQALHDGLTGLANRTQLYDRLSHSINAARRNGKMIAMLSIDLDHFKHINDSLGHDAGDDVLRQAASRLETGRRGTDVISRVGGDEFCIVLGDVSDPRAIERVAHQVVVALSEPYESGGQSCQIGASVGVALFPGDGETLEGLRVCSDQALYEAKRKGRNQVCFFAPRMGDFMKRQQVLEAGLRCALDNGEFHLAYQPKISARSGNMCGVEALLRWDHPDLGVVSPGEFIPLLEESRRILPVSDWLIDVALDDFARWSTMAPEDFTLALNLSARQIEEAGLVSSIDAAMRRHGVPAEKIELEVTESLFLQRSEQVDATIRGLHLLGCGLSLDDFGTGYSALAYLVRFPFNVLKLDRSFVRDLPGRADARRLTEAVFAVADSFELSVVAEGVETSEQLRYLKQMDCDAYQGFFFSKPLPGTRIDEMLHQRTAAGEVNGAA